MGLQHERAMTRNYNMHENEIKNHNQDKRIRWQAEISFMPSPSVLDPEGHLVQEVDPVWLL